MNLETKVEVNRKLFYLIDCMISLNSVDRDEEIPLLNGEKQLKAEINDEMN